MFTTTNDFLGPYFLFAPSELFIRNVSLANGGGIVSFLNPILRIPVVSRSDKFDANAINQSFDEVLLAVLSLLIILLIDALTACFLLVTTDGKVYPFGFAVNQFIALVRDFRFLHIRGRLIAPPRKRRFELRVALVAVSVLVVAFTCQVLVLVFSVRDLRAVTNAERAFEIVQPISPDWNTIRNSSTFLINQPCHSIIFHNVNQGSTTITNCVTSALPANSFEPYDIINDNTSIAATIISDLHPYGADHTLIIDGTSVQYVARSYFTLDDLQMRVMKQRARFNKQDRQMLVIHKQFFAYLFTSYFRMTGDDRMGLQRLNELDFHQVPTTNGSVISIVQTNNGKDVFRTASFRYQTEIRGTMPSGTAVFRFAQSFFKSIIAVEVKTADETDLFANDGVKQVNGVLWDEGIRRLNWLTAIVLLVSMGTVLVLSRWWLKPMDVAEIVGGVLKEGNVEDGSAVRVEAREDDGEREFYARSLMHAVRGYDPDLRMGAGGDEQFLRKQEYPDSLTRVVR